MLKNILRRKNLLVILAITSIALSLSMVSYQYSTYTSDEIAKIGSEDIASNAENEAYDLSRIIINKIDAVTTNLQILSNGPSIQQSRTTNIVQLFDAAQYSTDELTEYYLWLDKDGRIMSASNIARATYQYRSTWQSEKPLFLTEPERTGSIYYSGVLNSADNVNRLYISYPIIYSLQDNELLKDEFTGVIVAVIRLDTLGRLLQNELSPAFQSVILLADSKGALVYATDESLIEKSLLEDPSILLSLSSLKLSGSSAQEVKAVIDASLHGQSGSKNVAVEGKQFTFGYHPIIHNDIHFWTLYIVTPHTLNDNVSALLSKQDSFTMISLLVIGSVSAGIAYLVITWNRRLENIVLAKTSELIKANELLTESNIQLALANEQLRKHEKLQREFVNIAAHELRTPIMPILGMTDILDAQFGQHNEIMLERKDFEIILRNARRLEKLATDVLDVSRIETQSFHLDEARFDLYEIIELAVEDAKRQTVLNNVRFVIEAESGMTVFADKSRIRQVLSNLLSNATRFTDDGSITVTAKEDRDNNCLLLSVSDTGTGVDPEIIPRLFEKFATRSGTDRPQSGSGLGLYVSKKIVEAHGGKIWAENNTGGRGATIRISIPILERVTPKH